MTTRQAIAAFQSDSRVIFHGASSTTTLKRPQAGGGGGGEK